MINRMVLAMNTIKVTVRTNPSAFSDTISSMFTVIVLKVYIFSFLSTRNIRWFRRIFGFRAEYLESPEIIHRIQALVLYMRYMIVGFCQCYLLSFCICLLTFALLCFVDLLKQDMLFFHQELFVFLH